jgi:hypothetical protein
MVVTGNRKFFRKKSLRYGMIWKWYAAMGDAGSDDEVVMEEYLPEDSP